MIIINWKLFIKYLLVFIILLSIVLLTNNYINNKVAVKIQNIQEKNAKNIADIRLECETKKLEESAELKKQIIDLESELQKSKLLIEKIQRKGKVTEQIKKDVNAFIKEFDKLTGTKGKMNEK